MKLINMYMSTCAWSATCKTSASELADSVDDATTLIQTRVRRNTQPHPAIPEVQQDGVVSHVSLETVERLVNDISAKDPTAEEISLVSDLIATMENEFLPELAAQSEADSARHATQIAAHTACITARATRMGLGGDVTKFEEDSSKTRAKHQACRKATKSYSVFKNDLDSLSAGNWGNLAPSADNGQLSAVLSLSANQDEFTTDVAAYRGLETEGVVSESCDVDQEAFELTWCNWLNAKVSTCQAFGQCVDQVDAAASKAHIMTRDARRRATYHSMKILQCRLQHIADTFNSAGGASNSTEIDDCGDVAAPQENHYNLSLEDPTPAVGCLTDDDITDPKMPTATDPSACAQWRSKEYNADAQQHPTTWALALHSPVSKCLGTCVIATGAGHCTGSAFIKQSWGISCVLTSENKVVCDYNKVDIPYTGEAKFFDIWNAGNMCVVDTSDVAHFSCQGQSKNVPETVADVHMCVTGRQGACALFLNGTLDCWGDNSLWFKRPLYKPETTDNFGLVKDLQKHVYGACMVLQDDTVKCPIGIGNRPTLKAWENGGVPVKQFRSNYYGMCVINSNDTFKCAGSYDAMIDWTPADLKVKDVFYTDKNICAIRLADDVIQCWGQKSEDPPADFGTAKFLVSQASGGCAVLTSGAVKCWPDSRRQYSTPGNGIELKVSSAAELC